MSDLLARPTWCYVISDDHWRNLYVGITCDIYGRMRQHRHDKCWWPEVDIVHATLYPNRSYAVAWEAAHIRSTVRPLYNVDTPSARPLPPEHFADCVVDEIQLFPGEDI